MTIFSLFSSRKIFWGLYAFVVAGWILYAICDYLFFGFRTWDTALHVQPVIHWAMFGEYEDKILAVSHPFINHFRPGLLLLAPFLYVWPTMLVIHLAKIVTFATCPLLFLYFGKKFNLGKCVYAIPTLWLIHDVIITTMYAENQATSLALPLIVLAFMFALTKRYSWMWVPMIGLLFFKENLALVWMCLGMFIAVEQKKYRLGSMIVALGVAIGFLIYFVVIPSFGSGGMQHSADSFAPFMFVGDKLLMLVRAYLAMGFFVYFRPKALLYTLPAYGVFLVGGEKVHQAFFLANHTHDFPTTILFCAVFYLLIETVRGRSTFNIKTKGHRRYLKTCLVILGLFWVAKLPLLELAIKAPIFSTAYTIRQHTLQARGTIDPATTVYASGRVMDMFLDYQYIRSFDLSRGNHIRPYEERAPYVIVFPTHPKYSLLRPTFINPYMDILRQHHQLGLCELTILDENLDTAVYVAYYSQQIPKAEKDKLMPFFRSHQY